jgi:hypothetical protein
MSRSGALAGRVEVRHAPVRTMSPRLCRLLAPAALAPVGADNPRSVIRLAIRLYSVFG